MRSSLGVLRFERRLYPAAEMNFVLLDAAADDLLRLLAAECVRGRGVLVLERFVDLEKVRNLAGTVRRNLAYVLVKVPGRVLEGNGDDLVVDRVAVDHAHRADGVAVHLHHRVERFRAKDQNVERIAVIGISTRNKAVIRRIMRRGVQDSVETQQPGLFVQLVLFLAAGRYFDDCGEMGRRDCTGSMSCQMFLMSSISSCIMIYTSITEK